MKLIPNGVWRASVLALLLLPICTGPSVAQQPNSLKYIVPAPAGRAQEGAKFGWSVAMDGNVTVVGVPGDDHGARMSGVVKVFDSTTGALRLLIPHPHPEQSGAFGESVAISGTLVVVGNSDYAGGLFHYGRVYVFDLGSDTPTVPVVTLNNPNFASGFGYSVAISGTRIVVGSQRDSTGANQAGSAYIYDLNSATPTTPVATLNNPSPLEEEQFGSSVAISGARVVVGADAEATGGYAGSAYVYDLNGATPTTPVATLNNPSPGEVDYFGHAVAISGTRVVVGAPNDDTGTIDSGSAYVYDLGSGTPTVPVATLNNPSPAVHDAFGDSVAVSGTRVIVGSPHDDTGKANAGTAYVYDLGGETPTVPVAILNNPHPAPVSENDKAATVAISGMRVVVGYPQEPAQAMDAGIAYVYDLGSSTPTAPAATLNSPSPSSGDYFGAAVAFSGTRMVVGAYKVDVGADNSGIAYVYDLSSSTPAIPVITLVNPNPGPEDWFGYAVAISGTRVVVGAYEDNTVGSSSGSAYVYDLSSNTPTVPVAILNNPTHASRAFFGLSVAISGTRVVVGAPTDGFNATAYGNAYMYDLASGTPTVPVATLNNPSPASGDFFGDAVAISDTWLVVGARGDDTGGSDAGSAYIYHLNNGAPALTTTLNNPIGENGGFFGDSVAIAGSRLVVGASRDDVGFLDQGSAYVYDLGSGTPTVLVVTLNKPGPEGSENFGTSVAISGTRVVVGDNWTYAGSSFVGSAYVYDLSSGTPTVPVAALKKPARAEREYFGTSVAIDGTTVAVGTPLDNLVATEKGAVYIFDSNPNDLDGNGLLDSWEVARFGSATGHAATADPEGDGLINLLEEAFDTNPLQSGDTALPAIVNENGYLTVTISKRPGVSYLVQGAAQPNPALFTAAATTVLIDNATTLKVRDNYPIGTTPGRFMRVKVTAAP